MLMVTRESGEVLRLVMGGETVEIRIVSIGTRRVRLAIDAPQSVRIHRNNEVPEIPTAPVPVEVCAACGSSR